MSFVNALKTQVYVVRLSFFVAQVLFLIHEISTKVKPVQAFAFFGTKPFVGIYVVLLK